MSVFLERIDLRSYRSCKKTIIDLNQNLSTLIGANGSGKSNILNGLLLLKKITRISRYRAETDAFRSGCKLGAQFNVDGKLIKYQALIQYVTNDRNMDEVVSASEKWNFKEITGQNKWFSIPLSSTDDLYRFGKRIIRHTSKGNLAYVRFDPVTVFNLPKGAKGVTIVSALEKIHHFISGINYYSASRFTDPSKCPASFELESDRLSHRSMRPWDEHVQLMYDLYSAHKNNKDEYEEFISLVGSEGIGLVEAIEYDEIEAPSSSYQVITGGRLIKKEVKRTLVIPSITIHGNRLSFNQL